MLVPGKYKINNPLLMKRDYEKIYSILDLILVTFSVLVISWPSSFATKTLRP